MQVCKTRTCMQTCDGWPNGFTSWLAHKFTQAAKGQKFQAYTDGWQSSCADLRWEAKWLKTCINLHTNLNSTEVNASPCKSTQVGGQMQVENLRRLASPFGQGLSVLFHAWINHFTVKGEFDQDFQILNCQTKQKSLTTQMKSLDEYILALWFENLREDTQLSTNSYMLLPCSSQVGPYVGVY